MYAQWYIPTYYPLEKYRPGQSRLSQSPVNVMGVKIQQPEMWKQNAISAPDRVKGPYTVVPPDISSMPKAITRLLRTWPSLAASTHSLEISSLQTCLQTGTWFPQLLLLPGWPSSHNRKPTGDDEKSQDGDHASGPGPGLSLPLLTWSTDTPLISAFIPERGTRCFRDSCCFCCLVSIYLSRF